MITAVSWAAHHPAVTLAALARLLALSGAALAATFRAGRRGGDR